MAKQIQFLHLWGQVVVCCDIPRSKKDLEPFAMLVCVCFDVLRHLQKPWPKHSKTVTAIQSIKSLAGTRRGMRHGQQLQLVVPGCRGCYQGPQYRTWLESTACYQALHQIQDVTCHIMSCMSWIFESSCCPQRLHRRSQSCGSWRSPTECSGVSLECYIQAPTCSCISVSNVFCTTWHSWFQTFQNYMIRYSDITGGLCRIKFPRNSPFTTLSRSAKMLSNPNKHLRHILLIVYADTSFADLPQLFHQSWNYCRLFSPHALSMCTWTSIMSKE